MKQRLEYPDDHIEADNRLTWFLSLLPARYPDAFYVHLTRDPDEVVASFLKRWDQGRSNIVRSFGNGILVRPDALGPKARHRAARMYVATVTETITEFLRTRDHLSVALETVDTDFPKFLDGIGAEGDSEAAMAEWAVRHNAS